MEVQTTKNKEIIKDFLNAIWINRDLDRALSFVANDVRYHGVRNEFQGKENYGKMINGYLSVFDEVTIDIEDMVAEKNKVYFRATFSGIHNGEFEGILPTHKKVKFALFNEMEFEEGKIKADWDMMDELGLMQQLGMELKPKELAH